MPDENEPPSGGLEVSDPPSSGPSPLVKALAAVAALGVCGIAYHFIAHRKAVPPPAPPIVAQPVKPMASAMHATHKQAHHKKQAHKAVHSKTSHKKKHHVSHDTSNSSNS